MISLAFDLSNIGTLLLFIIIIAFLIAWHELGHLFVAKKCNVYCYEYAIGFGPVLYKNTKKETHICIRAIPLGGFVKMAGEEGLEEGEVLLDNNGNEVPKDRVLSNQSVGKRALVMAAGGIMNILLALFCFYFYISFNKIYVSETEYVTGFVQQVNTNETRISTDSLLADAGMETGDEIIKIETNLNTGEYEVYTIKNFADITSAIDSCRPEKSGDIQNIKITYVDVSDNQTKVASVARNAYFEVDENGNETENLKVSTIGLAQNYKIHEYNALTGIYGTFHFMGYYTVEVCRSFGELFRGNMDQLSGLVGIYGTIDQVATEGDFAFGARVLNIVYIIGAISFSLGFFNLIPFPALDGGRLVFVGIEALTKKKVNPNVEATIHFVGIILLFALMIIINVRDVIKLF